MNLTVNQYKNISEKGKETNSNYQDEQLFKINLTIDYYSYDY